MKLIIATTVLALAGGVAFAQEPATGILELAKPKIEFIDAAGIAGAAVDGDLVAMELDYINENEPVYLAALESETGFSHLMIDGNDGEVLVADITTAVSEQALDAYMEEFSPEAETAALLDMWNGPLDIEELKLLEEELLENHPVDAE